MIELVVSLYALVTLVLLVMRLEVGLLLLLPLLPLTPYAYRSPVTGLNATNLVIYVAFAMALFRRMGRQQVGLPPGAIPLFFFFCMILMAWVFGYLNYRSEGYESIRQLINVQRWVLYTLLYFAYFFAWPEDRPVTTAFRWMFAGIMIAVLFNFYERAFPGYYYLTSGRTGGIFRQANSNGIFLGTYLLLPLALTHSARSAVARWFYVGSFVLGVFSLMLALSRTGFLSLIAGSLVYAFYRSRRTFIAMIFALMALVPTYSILLPEKVVNRIDQTFRGSRYEGVAGKLEGSAANRLVQSIAGLRLFLDSPIIGHGIGGFWHRSPRYLPANAPDVARSAHTTFIWILVEGGAVTLGAFIWLLLGLLMGGKRVLEGGATDGQRMLGLYMMSIVVAKSLANTASTDFFTGDVSAYFWVSGGLVAWMVVHLGRESRTAAPAAERATVAKGPRRVASPWRPRQPASLTRGKAHE